MNTVLDKITQTPWWVYLIFIVLIARGIKALNGRVVPFRKLFILPTIFLILSVHTLISAFNINMLNIAFWVGGLLIGASLGTMLTFSLKLNVDKKHLLIFVPGTWTTLTFILILFASKYYFGYEMSVDPNLILQPDFKYSMLAVSGVAGGLFIGRLLVYSYRLWANESMDLLSSPSR